MINVNTDLSYDLKLSVHIHAIIIQIMPADNVKSRPFFDFTDKLTRNSSKDSVDII